MKHSYHNPPMPEAEQTNRGISGQPLQDSKNKPGDPHTGKQGSGETVNLDPTSRDDEGC